MDVYLDKKFWTANPYGTNSQAGIILHEVSHFSWIGNTVDTDRKGNKVYGVPDVKNLILSDPNRALRHADTFEYYLEHAF